MYIMLLANDWEKLATSSKLVGEIGKKPTCILKTKDVRPKRMW